MFHWDIIKRKEIRSRQRKKEDALSKKFEKHKSFRKEAKCFFKHDKEENQKKEK